MSGIIRTRRAPSTFFQARKAPFLDERLSFAARGLLAYLFTKPDNWETRNYDLVNASPGGKAALQSILHELKEYGYISRKSKKNSDGAFSGWETTVYEDPAENPDFGKEEQLQDEPLADIPVFGKTDKPTDRKPVVPETGRSENQEEINKNNPNENDLNNIDNSGATLPPPPAEIKKPSPKKEKTTKQPKPASVLIYREITHRYPPGAMDTVIEAAVGNDPGALEFWRQVVLGYIGQGWNPANLNGMLEFYKRGEVPSKPKAFNGNGNGNGAGNGNGGGTTLSGEQQEAYKILMAQMK